MSLLIIVNWNVFGQVVEFSTNPASTNGEVSICQNTSIQFTNTSIGIAPGSNYIWTFDGGTPNVAFGEGPLDVSFNTPGDYIASLDVDGTIFSIQITVVSEIFPVFNVGIGSNFIQGAFNGAPYFLACSGDPINLLSISANSLGTNANTVHTISWGNGQPDFVYTGANFIFHPVNMNSSTFYTQGEYLMSYTIDNGACTSEIQQMVFAGMPPGGSIENTLQAQSFCIPGAVSYNINPQSNVLGTIYTIEFNDGNNSTYSFPHPPPAVIDHTFPVNSCGTSSTFNGVTYLNSFSVTMTTANACGQSTSGIAPIVISETPIADMFISDTIVCVNEIVTFVNASFNGSNVTGGIIGGMVGCDTLSDVIWTYDPLANVVLVDGDLGTLFSTPIGTQWFPGTETIQLMFTEPGQYSVTMKVRNKPQCGEDSITRTICVIPALVADFEMQDTSVCVPYTLTPTNLSNSVTCDNSNVFNWTVTRTNPQDCPYGSDPGYTFTNGTNANSAEPTFHFTASGIYEIQLINSLETYVPGNDCQGDTLVRMLYIKDIPYIELEPLLLCSGSEYTLAPVHSDCYADNGLVYDWNFSPSSASIPNSNSPNPVISYATVGNYSYSLLATNECGEMNLSETVVVESGIAVQASGPIADCINSPIPLTGIVSGAVTTGTWSSDLPGGFFSPNPTTLNPNFFFPNGFIGEIAFTLTSDSSTNGCPPAVESFILNINTTIYADAGENDTICINSSTNLLGSFGGIATSASWSSLGGGSFANANNPITTFTPPANFTGNIALVLTTNTPTGDCVAATDTVIITVVPLPDLIVTADTTICEGQSVNLEVSGAVDYLWDQNLGAGEEHLVSPTSTTLYSVTGTDIFGCINSTQVQITVLPAPNVLPISNAVYCSDVQSAEIVFASAFPNVTYSWERTPEIIGLAPTFGNGNIPSFQTSNTTSNSLVTTITVTPEADGCPGLPTSFTITVHPEIEFTNPISQELCPGLTQEVAWTTNLDPTLNVSYFWQLVSTSPNLSGAFLNGTGNLTSMMILNVGVNSETIVYEVVASVAGCFSEPFTYSIIVNPGPTMSPISTQEICSDTPFATTNFSASVAGSTFSWELTNTNIPAEISGYPQPSGDGNIQGTVIQNTGLDPYALLYSVMPMAANCTGAPEIFTLIVNPELTVQTSIPDQFICNNSSSELVALQANVQNSSVSWEVAILPNDIDGVNITSGFDTIPVFDLVNNHPTDVLDVVFSLIPLNADPLSCPGETVLYVISVFPTPTLDPISDSIICHGEETAEILFSGLATQFSWSHNGDNIGLLNTGIGNIPSFEIQNLTSSQTVAEFDVIPQVTVNNEVCDGTPAMFSFFINPLGTVNPLQDIGVCDGDSIPQINFTHNHLDGNVSFTWNNNNTSIGLPSSGNNNTIDAFLGMNSGTTSNIGVVSVQAIYSNMGVSCTGSAETFEISINPIPQIISIANTLICNAETLDLAPTTNIPSAFVWLGEPNPNVVGISTTVQISASINDQLENESADPQIVNYSIAPITPGTGCIGDTSQVEVIVEPYIFMTSPTVYEICSGTSVNALLTSNIPANYSWFATPNNNVLGSTNFMVGGNVINDILFNTTNVPQMLVYTVIPTTISGNCQGLPLIINVLVNPELQITSQSNLTICNNETLNYNITANANGIFSWFATQNGAVFGETTAIQNSNSISDQLFNNSNTVQQVTYNIVITSSNQGCTSQNFQFVVDVIPTPSIVAPSDFTVCNASQNAAISLNGNYTSFNWTNDNASTGIASFANNVTNFEGFTAVNTNNFPQASGIILTPVYDHNNISCSGVSQNFNITVNPTGQVNFLPTIEVCHATPVSETLVTTSNVTGNTTFSWTNNNVTTGLNLTGGQGNIPEFTSANTFSPDPNISTIAVVGNYVFNNVACPSEPFLFDIVVNPIPTLGAIPNQIHCNGDTVPALLFNGFGANHYVWNHNNASIGFPINGFGNLPQFTANNVGQSPTQSVLEVVPYYNSTISSLSCSGAAQTFNITIQPSPIVEFTTDGVTFCSRNDVTFFNNSGPNVAFNWDFGDGNSSFLTNPTHVYAGPGVYEVTLTGTHDFTGCVASQSTIINILETPIVSFSVDTAMQCYPATFTFTDDIQAPFTYDIWHFGDGLSVTQSFSVSHVYQEFDCYDVTLYVGSENGCIDSLTIPQMVCHFEAPIAFFSTDQSIYNTAYPVVNFYNESEFSTSYLWDFSYGSNSTAINPIHFYPEEEAEYLITLTAFNDIGCSDQYGLVIAFKEDRLFYVPNGFTPENLDGVNDFFLPTVSSGYDMSAYHLIVFNRWGEVVFESTNHEQAWDGTNSYGDGRPCPDGTYVWKLTLRGILEKDAVEYTGHVMLLR